MFLDKFDDSILTFGRVQPAGPGGAIHYNIEASFSLGLTAFLPGLFFYFLERGKIL